MIRIKLIAQLFLGLWCLCLAGGIYAADTKPKKYKGLMFCPYIGVDYQYEHIKSDSNWRTLLSANFQNVAIFVGAKYHKNFGIELGYYHWLKISQEQALVTSFNGLDVDGNGLSATKARMSFKGFSLDWDVYYQLDQNFNVYAIFGLATLHPHFACTAQNDNNFSSAFSLLTGKNYTSPRLGAGMEYVEKNWGARARIIWDYTQKMKLNVTAAQQEFANIYARAFQQGVLASVGIFYIF